MIRVHDVRCRADNERANYVQFIVSRSEDEVLSEYNSVYSDGRYEKIFYKQDPNKETKIWREWILYEEKNFYCVYCSCLDTHNISKNVRLTKGLDSDAPLSRLTQHITTHENSKLHKIFKNDFLKAVSPANSTNFNQRTAHNREIVKRIIKVIIFNATYSKFFGYVQPNIVFFPLFTFLFFYC